MQKAFVKIPYTFAEENMVLTGIEASYGVNNNSEAVTYTLRAVDSNGNATAIATWSHAGGTKFTSYTSYSISSSFWSGKYLYVTGSNSSYNGSGYTVSVIFTNGSCME